jgi:DNA helicase II / ATP-dependent DNA helicase PcrA
VTYQPTSAQRALIDARDPVLLVLGGTGTGKTSTAAAAARSAASLRGQATGPVTVTSVP